MSIAEEIHHFVTEGEDRVRGWFEAKAPEFDRLTKVAESVESDPGVQALMGAVGITAPARAAIGRFLTELDAEFQRVASEAHDAGRQAERDAQAPAEPEVPAE
jgi:hypothetical protein